MSEEIIRSVKIWRSESEHVLGSMHLNFQNEVSNKTINCQQRNYMVLEIHFSSRENNGSYSGQFDILRGETSLQKPL